MYRFLISTLVLGMSVSAIYGQAETNLKSEARQDPQSDTTQDEDPAKALIDEYHEIKQRLKKTGYEINDKFANLSFANREKKNQQLKVINELKAEKKRLIIAAFEKAVEAYRLVGNQDPDVARDVAGYANACYGGPNHQFAIDVAKSLELCELMIEKGLDNASVRSLAVRASIALQNFENATRHLNETTAAGRPVSNALLQEVAKIESKWKRESELRESQSNLPVVELDTSLGIITIELFEDDAPETVANFISLVESGFYDKQQFFGARRGEFCRSGCPKNNGTGHAGYRIFSECKKESARHHFTGSLSMIPYDRPGNNGSQFIISQRPVPQFDGSFTVFGRVTKGLEIVHQIVVASQEKSDAETPVIESTKIVYKRPNSTYAPNKVPEEGR